MVRVGQIEAKRFTLPDKKSKNAERLIKHGESRVQDFIKNKKLTPFDLIAFIQLKGMPSL